MSMQSIMGQVGVYCIADGSVLAGSLPANKEKLVVAWIEIHKEELAADWDLAVNGQTPFRIRGAGMMDITRLESVEVGEPHILHVSFSDGEKGEVDMKPYLSEEAFRPLMAPSEFAKIHNGGYFVEWACGADLSADTLRSRLTVLKP